MLSWCCLSGEKDDFNNNEGDRYSRWYSIIGNYHKLMVLFLILPRFLPSM